MEARLLRAALLAAALVASLGAGYRSTNFIVEAPTQELAEKIGKMAETYRYELAIDWLGSALPDWPQPCPIHAQVAPHLGAGGATSFVFDRGQVFGWQMNIQGSEERIIDSVLPHEVTHTIFATHFLRPLPRWADEGACTTVEHQSERGKQERMLIDFLKTQRGIAFSQMFVMTEYPQDILPLYAQGYALARFLIDQKGKHEFLAYLTDGMASNDWTSVTERHYGYKNLAVLQNAWLEWIKKGSPLENPAPGALEMIAAAKKGKAVVRAQAADRESVAMVPVVPVPNNRAAVPPANAAAATPGRRRARPDADPVRNGSVVIDHGDAVAMADVATATSATTQQASPPGAAIPPANQVAWHDPEQSAGNSDDQPRALAGRSVYGDGVPLIHRSSEARDYSAQLPSDDHPTEVPAAPASQQKTILEWSRQ